MISLKPLVSFILILIGLSNIYAQNPNALESIIHAEQANYTRNHNTVDQSLMSTANNKSDIKYTRMHWEVDPAVSYIIGEVMTIFQPIENVQNLDFDFSEALTMDSVKYHDNSLKYTITGDQIQVHFPTTLLHGSTDSLTFYYHGKPTSTGFGSFIVDEHAGTPVLWTLSEPYGAREWWPCKQSLNDKIDSIDVYITNPVAYKAASNGLLINESIANGKITAHWKHRYPIAAYLICMAVTNYEVFTEFAPFGNQTTTILNYVYPENLEDAKAGVAQNVTHMQLYDQLFGMYPFQNEKYGHAQFGWGGGMEHQTMTFVTSYGYELLAHELAHHWFGDKVTCGSWQDIWLNEGFATYLSGLCYQYLLPEYWLPFKQQRIATITSQPGGSVFVTDTSSVNRIFSGRLTYAKGAMILHQLRWICGDSIFFKGIRNYINDPAIAYSYAKTSDLKRHLETVSGKNLTGYFADWFTGQGYPSYQVSWSQDITQTIHVKLNQTQSHGSVDFFEMPVPLKINGPTGQSITIVLDNTFNGQNFSQQINFPIASVEFDPELWLITKDNTISFVVGVDPLNSDGYSLNIEPNPIQNGILQTIIESPTEQIIQSTIESVDGKIMMNKLVSLESGKTSKQFDVTGFPCGTYSLHLKIKQGSLTKKFVIQ